MNENATRSLNEQQQQAMNVAEAVMQGAARILEIQVAAARTMFETQGRTVSMFGAPDLCAFLKPAGFTDLLNASAQQATTFMRQTSDTLSEVQRQLSQGAEAQTKWMTDQMRKGMDEFTRQTGESLKLWRDASRHAVEEAERSVQPAQQATESSNDGPAIVVSGGLQGTRTPQSRPEERAKATAKR